MGFLRGFQLEAKVLAFTEGIWTLVMLHRPLSLYHTKHRRESMTGTTRVINSLLKGKPRFRQGSNLNEGKLSTLKNNPGSGVGIISFPMGIISFPIVKPS